MGFITLLLIAALLCAESPNGSIRDRYLITQTIVYRSEQTGLDLLPVITQKGQYQGLGLIDWQGYRLYRQLEMRQNLVLVMGVLKDTNRVRVSNFCSVGISCSWESSCRIIETTDHHKFYLCPEWV